MSLSKLKLPQTKFKFLCVMTALAVSYVRHGLETKWGPWGSKYWDSPIEQFLGYWFINGLGLLFFVVIAGVIIEHNSGTFLEHKIKAGKDEYSSEVEHRIHYQIVMTILLLCAVVWLGAHWIATPDDGGDY